MESTLKDKQQDTTVGRLQAQVVGLSNDINALKKQIDTFILKLEESNKKDKFQIHEDNRKLFKLAETVGELQEEITDLNKRIGDLEYDDTEIEPAKSPFSFFDLFKRK